MITNVKNYLKSFLLCTTIMTIMDLIENQNLTLEVYQLASTLVISAILSSMFILVYWSNTIEIPVSDAEKFQDFLLKQNYKKVQSSSDIIYRANLSLHIFTGDIIIKKCDSRLLVTGPSTILSKANTLFNPNN